MSGCPAADYKRGMNKARSLLSEDTLWAVVATLAAVVAGVVLRNAVKGGYRLTHHGDNPPQNPEDPGTDWGETILFMGLTGAAVGIARVLGRRGAAAGWRRVTGHAPRALMAR